MNYTKSKLSHGYANTILTVDLGTGVIATPELDPEVRDYFIGGRGLGLYLLHQSDHPAYLRLRSGKPPDPRERPARGDPPVPRDEQVHGRFPLPPDRHPGCLEFRRLFRRLSQVCRIRCPGSDGKSRPGLYDRHRRVSAGNLHDGCARRRSGLRPGERDRRPFRPGRARQTAHRLRDDRHGRRHYHVWLHQQPLLRCHQAGGRDPGDLPDQTGRPDRPRHRDDGQEDQGHRRPGGLSPWRQPLWRGRLGQGEAVGGEAP